MQQGLWLIQHADHTQQRLVGLGVWWCADGSKHDMSDSMSDSMT
jgi:hypothetical protein